MMDLLNIRVGPIIRRIQVILIRFSDQFWSKGKLIEGEENSHLAS